MTDKQKEAIEYFKKRIDICMENANICDDNDFDEEATYLRKEQILIETVLKLIQTQQAEIKKKDKMIEYMTNFINEKTPYTKDTRILENERGVRNTKYTEQYFEYKVEEEK